ncbi:hypothetical protein [Spirosoma horti]
MASASKYLARAASLWPLRVSPVAASLVRLLPTRTGTGSPRLRSIHPVGLPR